MANKKPLVLNSGILEEIQSNDKIASSDLSHSATTVEEELDQLSDMHIDSNEPTGFIREFPYTMGVLEFSDDGTNIKRLFYNGSSQVYSANATGLFYDGTVATARTLSISPMSVADGGDDTFTVYVESVKHVLTVAQRATISDVTSTHAFRVNKPAVLESGIGLHFTDTPITAAIYWDKTLQKSILFSDERHGITMSGDTHKYLHFTQGCQYVSGMGINGLVSGSELFTSIDSGEAFDEDISVLPIAQTNTPTIYAEWDAVIGDNVWKQSTANLETSYKVGGTTQYNLNTAGQFSLANITGNDASIYFFFMTNDVRYPYVKVMGQNVYGSTNVARAAVEDELNSIVLGGLPAPELIAIAAIIVRSSGEVKTLSDGSVYLDLRQVKIAGSGTVSGSSSYHADLLGKDEVDQHPISAITGLSTHINDTTTHFTQGSISITESQVSDLTHYTHPATDGNLHVPANSTTNSGKVLTAGATAGLYTWETPSAAGITIGDAIVMAIALG